MAWHKFFVSAVYYHYIICIVSVSLYGPDASQRMYSWNLEPRPSNSGYHLELFLAARVCEGCPLRFMRGGFIFRNRGPTIGPSLKVTVYHGNWLKSVTKHGSGGSPPGAACDSAKPPHDKTQGSASGWRSQLSPHLPNGHFPRRPEYYSTGEIIFSIFAFTYVLM